MKPPTATTVPALAALLALAPLALSQDGGRPEGAGLPAPAEPRHYVVGSEVDPDIEMPTIDGRVIRLGDYRRTEEREGAVVVLNFWSIDCPWSRGYEPRMKELHERFSPKGAVLLMVDPNPTELEPGAEDPYKRIRAYAEKAEVPYPVLVDRGHVVADRFGALTTPHVYVIDRDGVIQYAGGVDDDPKAEKGDEREDWTGDAIAAVLAGETVPRAETRPFGCTIKRQGNDGR